MSKHEELFNEISSIKYDIQVLSSIFQNEWESPPNPEILERWSDDLDRAILKLLDVKLEVLEFFK